MYGNSKRYSFYRLNINKEMPGNLPGNFAISGRKYCNK
jgi:hypothetical protein